MLPSFVVVLLILRTRFVILLVIQFDSILLSIMDEEAGSNTQRQIRRMYLTIESDSIIGEKNERETGEEQSGRKK